VGGGKIYPLLLTQNRSPLPFLLAEIDDEIRPVFLDGGFVVVDEGGYYRFVGMNIVLQFRKIFLPRQVSTVKKFVARIYPAHFF
jgi:hypothetical protein